MVIGFLKKICEGKEFSSLKILDIGCGTGGMLANLQQEGFNDAYGIDKKPISIHLTAKREIKSKRFEKLTGFLIL